MISTLIPAISLAIVGLLLLTYVAVALWGSFGGVTRGFADKSRLARKERAITKIEVALTDTNFVSALGAFPALFKDAIFADAKLSDPTALELLTRHHERVLGALAELAERLNVSLSMLPILEDLLISRGELLTELADTGRARGEILKKRKDKGQNIPSWALDEFDKKTALLHDRLATNERSIKSQLDDALKAISSGNKSGELSYH